MKLAILILTVGCLHLSASVMSQQVSARFNGASLDNVLAELGRQTNYNFVYDSDFMQHTRPVTADFKGTALTEALETVFAGQPLAYEVRGHHIIVRRAVETGVKAAENLILAYAEVKGRVVDSTGAALFGASIRVLNSEGKRTALQAKTNHDGYFLLNNVPDDAQLEITYVGFMARTLAATADVGTILLRAAPSELEEVEVMVNTGYQTLPKERATGSFAHVDNQMLNRSVSTDILSRLEGVTGSLAFDFPQTRSAPSSSPNLRVRGVSTINSPTAPLIILDNFPFEGDINNINPNDVAEVTVLKDASASSIWGARAGNGVIVITTKKTGTSKYPSISYNQTVNVIKKPNLFYSRYFLPTGDYIELERLLYSRGNYAINDWTPLSPVVETLIAKDRGLLQDSEAESRIAGFGKYDIRNDASRLLYRRGSQQQYSLNMAGGNEVHRYYLSGGYDRNAGSVVGDDYRRNTILFKNDLQLASNLRFTADIAYVMNHAKNNGVDMIDIAPLGLNYIYTYAQLADDSGKTLPIVRAHREPYIAAQRENGLLDWQYRPLDEAKLNSNETKSDEFRVNTAINYRIIEGFNAEARYQFQQHQVASTALHDQDSYFVRNLVNRFTQTDFTTPIPLGDIMDRSANTYRSHYGRMQLNYETLRQEYHSIAMLSGVEIRQESRIGAGGHRLYGYNDDFLTFSGNINHNSSWRIRPNGSSTIPSGLSAGSHSIDRFLSVFGNFAYSYKSTYTLSSSVRWDGSNIFGVDFNQKGVPLWSVGVAWDALKDIDMGRLAMDRFKVRFTYGVSGNTLPSLSALPYVSYRQDFITNYRSGVLGSIGNPQLRWERVKTLNGGTDFSFLRKRLSGSVDFFYKFGTDLIGPDDFDPTTGVIWTGLGYNMENNRNRASMNTFGTDLELNTVNVQAGNGFTWKSTLLVHLLRNRVKKYYGTGARVITDYLYSNVPPAKGTPISQVYAIPWNGLDETGSPLVLVDGELGRDYSRYFDRLAYEDLLKVGIASPPFFGSLMNTFYFKNISFSFNVMWKTGHVFRRGSVNYSSLVGSSKIFHMDYLDRWRAPGDESRTHVPSMPAVTSGRRDDAYLTSETLIEKADLIRLQDIQLGYVLPLGKKSKVGVRDIGFNAYARNLGLIWAANGQGLDPDVTAFYPRQTEIGFGFTLGL